MRIIILLILSITIATITNAQKIDTVYYDKNWKTVISPIEAEYFKQITRTDSSTLVSGYFIDGKIQMKGSYLDSEQQTGTGDIFYYYHDGSLKAIDSWKDGTIEKQIWKYPSGKIKSKGGFKSIQNNGSMEVTPYGNWEYYAEDGSVISKGSYNEYGRHDKWEIYGIDGTLMSHNIYKNGVLQKIELANPKRKFYYEYSVNINNYGIAHNNAYNIEKTEKEFRVVGEFMQANVDFYKQNSTTEEARIISEYVWIWTSNAPYLGKFVINTNMFIYTYSTIPNYSSKEDIPICIMLGICAYKISLDGEPFNKEDSYIYVANYMAEWYEHRLIAKPDCRNEMMDKLLKAHKKDKVKKYIKSFSK